MKFNLPEFRKFCKTLRVDTKELGVVFLGDVLLGTQMYVIEEIAKGIDEGVHYFVILKARQLGITTVTLALDLYWHFKFAGIQGTLITDTEENRDMFKATLSMYMDGLPNQWKRPIRLHNRNQLVIGNRSRMAYQVAGTKKKERRSVGVGKAIMFMHATECSNWGDEGALADIEASLAQKNEKRLYIFESTARGYNQFEEMWQDAKRARTQRAIFVGWWRNEMYAYEEGSPEFNVYWDGKLTPDESRRVREVKELYDFEITKEQIAWYRYTAAEHQREESRMLENYPWTEDDAFQMSGSKFFSSITLADRMKQAKSAYFDAYRFVFGLAMGDTELVDSDPDFATLKIWQKPKANGYYAIGADPAYGSSEWKDRFCIQVYRCYADGMDQVAEFCTADCDTTRFAWLVLYLAGAYNAGLSMPNIMMNLEVNGPGMFVWQEMQNMRRMAGMDSGLDPKMAQVIFNMQNFLYRRQDSISGNVNYHTKTTTMEKERFMSAFRDGFEAGIIGVHSPECLEEMKKVQRSDGDISVPGRGKDDRVIASALATIAWHDFVRLQLASRGMTRAKSIAEKPEHAATNATERNVMDYLKAIGLERKPSVH